MSPPSPRGGARHPETCAGPPGGPPPGLALPGLLEVEASPNRLLGALPPGERQHMLGGCERVRLAFAEIVAEVGEPIRHVYFPTDSFISLVTLVDRKAMLEVGMVGNEGVLGTPLLLGLDISPLRAVVHGPGQALRMERLRFVRELSRNPTLHRLLQRYLYLEMGQFARNAACNRYHRVEARLARWLLMTHDRAHAPSFHITHEFLAGMLGVRRVGVTQAAGALQKRDLIRYARGDITILDRPGLEAASCACYAADTAAYARLLPGSAEADSLGAPPEE